MHKIDCTNGRKLRLTRVNTDPQLPNQQWFQSQGKRLCSHKHPGHDIITTPGKTLWNHHTRGCSFSLFCVHFTFILCIYFLCLKRRKRKIFLAHIKARRLGVWIKIVLSCLWFVLFFYKIKHQWTSSKTVTPGVVHAFHNKKKQKTKELWRKRLHTWVGRRSPVRAVDPWTQTALCQTLKAAEKQKTQEEEWEGCFILYTLFSTAGLWTIQGPDEKSASSILFIYFFNIHMFLLERKTNQDSPKTAPGLSDSDILIWCLIWPEIRYQHSCASRPWCGEEWTTQMMFMLCS